MIGGGPVEIGSGVAGLAYSWVLGRRQEKELLNFRPHNVSLIALGSMFDFDSLIRQHSIDSLASDSFHALVRLARV
jgi:hypothetical protein